ncbi:MAG: (2Fe-2S)-binding protein [Pseudomonadota bacterium]
MFVCICNALRERDIIAAANSAEGVSDVFRRCGREAQCGKCVPDVLKILDGQRAGQDEKVQDQHHQVIVDNARAMAMPAE